MSDDVAAALVSCQKNGGGGHAGQRSNTRAASALTT